MRTTSPITLGVFLAVCALTALSLAPAANAEDQPVNVSVRGGTLHATLVAPTLGDVLLDGQTEQIATATAPQWTIVDARGSGAAWSMSVEGTDFTSAAGTVDSTIRTMPIAALTIDPGTIAATTGSDPKPLHGIVSITAVPQPLVWASTGAKGSFTLTPDFTVTVPTNAFRSNFAVGQTGAINPYVTLLTFTIS